MAVGATFAAKVGSSIQLVAWHSLVALGLLSQKHGHLINAPAEQIIVGPVVALAIAKVTVGLAKTDQAIAGRRTDHPKLVAVILEFHLHTLPPMVEVDVEEVEVKVSVPSQTVAHQTPIEAVLGPLLGRKVRHPTRLKNGKGALKKVRQHFVADVREVAILCLKLIRTLDGMQ